MDFMPCDENRFGSSEYDQMGQVSLVSPKDETDGR